MGFLGDSANYISRFSAHRASAKKPAEARSLNDNTNIAREKRVIEGVKAWGVSTTCLVLAGVLGYQNLDRVRQLFPNMGADAAQRLRNELNAKRGGPDLLNRIDNLTNPNVKASDFLDFAEQKESTSDSCISLINLITEDAFITTDPNKGLQLPLSNVPPYVTTVKGLKDIENLPVATEKLKLLEISCRLTRSQIPSNLRATAINIADFLSDTLVADPEKTAREGVDPGGFYSPVDKNIYLILTKKGGIFYGLLPHEEMHAVDDKSGGGKQGDDTIQKQILTEGVFKRWESESFPGDKNVSPELKAELESMGLRSYSVDASRFTDEYKRIKKEMVESGQKISKIDTDKKLLTEKIKEATSQKAELERQLNEAKQATTSNNKTGSVQSDLSVMDSKLSEITKFITQSSTELANLDTDKAKFEKYIKHNEELLAEAYKIIVFSPEVIATAFEALFELEDEVYNRPATQAMLGRALDILYEKTKGKAFSPQNREQYKQLVRGVRKLVKEGKYDEANRLIDQNSDFLSIKKLDPSRYKDQSKTSPTVIPSTPPNTSVPTPTSSTIPTPIQSPNNSINSQEKPDRAFTEKRIAEIINSPENQQVIDQLVRETVAIKLDGATCSGRLITSEDPTRSKNATMLALEYVHHCPPEKIQGFTFGGVDQNGNANWTDIQGNVGTVIQSKSKLDRYMIVFKGQEQAYKNKLLERLSQTREPINFSAFSVNSKFGGFKDTSTGEIFNPKNLPINVGVYVTKRTSIAEQKQTGRLYNDKPTVIYCLGVSNSSQGRAVDEHGNRMGGNNQDHREYICPTYLNPGKDVTVVREGSSGGPIAIFPGQDGRYTIGALSGAENSIETPEVRLKSGPLESNQFKMWGFDSPNSDKTLVTSIATLDTQERLIEYLRQLQATDAEITGALQKAGTAPQEMQRLLAMRF